MKVVTKPDKPKGHFVGQNIGDRWLRTYLGVIGHSLLVLAQSCNHKYIAQGSFKADH